MAPPLLIVASLKTSEEVLFWIGHMHSILLIKGVYDSVITLKRMLNAV